MMSYKLLSFSNINIDVIKVRKRHKDYIRNILNTGKSSFTIDF